MAFLISLLHVDWQGDGRWVGYEIFGGARVPAPHTWQDWIAAILLIGGVLTFFVAGACFVYWWRKDVMGVFSTYGDAKEWVEDMRAAASAKMARRKADRGPPHRDLRGPADAHHRDD